MKVRSEQYASIYNGIFIHPFPAKSYLMVFFNCFTCTFRMQSAQNSEWLSPNSISCSTTEHWQLPLWNPVWIDLWKSIRIQYLVRDSYAHNIQTPRQSNCLNMDVCIIILSSSCLFALSQNEITTNLGTN